MSIFVIVLLILLGIALFIVEFFIIPGVTIAGIGGALLIGFGIYFAFQKSLNTGIYVLIAAISLFLIIFIIMFRSGTWKGIMLSSNIEGKINSIKTEQKIQPGDNGITITRLAPMGKVQVKGEIVEAKSLSGFLDENIEIEVTKVLNTNIIVKPKNS